MITSDGDKVSNPEHFNKHYRRLRRASKSLSRKQKGSKNREKARIKVARIHAQITDNRKDHLHKLTTQLVRENQTIVVENLAVKNLVKNPKLSQAISDVSCPPLPPRPPRCRGGRGGGGLGGATISL